MNVDVVAVLTHRKLLLWTQR